MRAGTRERMISIMAWGCTILVLLITPLFAEPLPQQSCKFSSLTCLLPLVPYS
jgi:hypothetical protein